MKDGRGEEEGEGKGRGREGGRGGRRRGRPLIFTTAGHQPPPQSREACASPPCHTEHHRVHSWNSFQVSASRRKSKWGSLHLAGESSPFFNEHPGALCTCSF